MRHVRKAAIKRQRGLLPVFGHWWDAQFVRLERGYCALLQATLTGRLPPSRRGPGLRWLAIVIGSASLAAGLAVPRIGRVSVDVFPSGDQSEIDITLTMPPSTDISTTDSVVQQLESAVRTYPEVDQVYSHTGSGSGPAALASGAGGGGDTSQLTVLLVPPGQRTHTPPAWPTSCASSLVPRCRARA